MITVVDYSVIDYLPSVLTKVLIFVKNKTREKALFHKASVSGLNLK